MGLHAALPHLSGLYKRRMRFFNFKQCTSISNFNSAKMLLTSLLMETDEKNLINQMYHRASVTVHMLQKRVCITHRSCMNGEKKSFPYRSPKGSRAV
jgi:hypothetical protein